MSVELEIGKSLNFYVYSEMGKTVVDTDRYPALNNIIKTHRNNLVD